VASLLAAGASWLRGGKYVYSEPEDGTEEPTAVDPARREPLLVGPAMMFPQFAGGGGRVITRTPPPSRSLVFRIGEVAKLTGLTPAPCGTGKRSASSTEQLRGRGSALLPRRHVR